MCDWDAINSLFFSYSTFFSFQTYYSINFTPYTIQYDLLYYSF